MTRKTPTAPQAPDSLKQAQQRIVSITDDIAKRFRKREDRIEAEASGETFVDESPTGVHGVPLAASK